jgi:hypothetical protein
MVFVLAVEDSGLLVLSVNPALFLDIITLLPPTHLRR